MKNIVDEDGEIIAKATDDHTLIGGHHRLAVAASLGQKLFWKPGREWRVAVISDLWPKTAGCGQMRQTEVDLDGVIQ